NGRRRSRGGRRWRPGPRPACGQLSKNAGGCCRGPGSRWRLQMPDMTIDVAGQITPPRLSSEALADYKRLLNDPKLAEERPELHAMLKASVENALAVTGQQLEPRDPRSPARQHFDRALAMEPNPELVAMCRRDSKGTEPPDPEQTATALAGIGLTRKDALDLAQHAVEQSKQLAGVKVENLPAITLAVLAKFGA